MRYSVAGVYLWALWMIDRLPEIFDRKKRMCLPACAAGWVTVLCTTVCMFQWTVSANYSFYQATLDYEKMYAQCVKFIDMAESHEDYMGGMPILVIGDMAYNDMRSVPALNQTKFYSSFMGSILGVNSPYGTANEVRDRARIIVDTPDFVTMSCYPAEDCVQVIEDCLVIKLGDTEA